MINLWSAQNLLEKIVTEVAFALRVNEIEMNKNISLNGKWKMEK